MNIKEIINWSLQRWWWFLISLVVCGGIGGCYLLFSAPKFQVEAVLMLRQTDSKNSSQDEMLQMMGFGGSKIVGDEVKVLTSRDLMSRVVDSLDLCTYYQKRGKRFWEDQFPQHDIAVELLSPVVHPVELAIKVKNGQYDVRIKYDRHRQHLTMSAQQPQVSTIVGEMRLRVNPSIEDGKYRATVLPRISRIDALVRQIKVNRLSRESNVIMLSTTTKCPQRSIATMNTLLDLYNQSAYADKNSLALQTEQFLINRIQVVAGELTSIESQLEVYKRTQQIADLDRAANTYQQTGLAYQQQLAELESELSVLDFMDEQLGKSENQYALIPGNLGISDNTLAELIKSYNSQVTHRNHLLLTATEQNPIVEQETQQIDQKRIAIRHGITQARQTLNLRKQFVAEQQSRYDSRLAAIPQTERMYLELSREKQTKENQYLYLIEKQEENALLLASDAVPAKIVDRAQLNPTPVAPNRKMVALLVLVLGMALPLSVYLFETIRKQFL